MLFDTHCHLDDPQFGVETPKVIQRAKEAGVIGMVCVGTDVASTKRALWFCSRHDLIWASAGLHPHFADKYPSDEAFKPIEDLARETRVLAIGETGLDYYKKFAKPENQKNLLRRHLKLATELGKPFVIHCRNAYDEIHDIFSKEFTPPLRGVMHCFGGTKDEAKKFLDLGLYLSIAGPITFPNASSLEEVVRLVPEDRLVIETDSPYLAPQQYRGQRNEPAYVKLVAQRIAEILNKPFEEVAAQTAANAKALFGIA